MENQPKRNIQKPVGIYVVCIAVILAHGLLPLLYYFREFSISNVDTTFPVAFISLFLPVFTIVTAIWTGYGYNSGRICLLILDSLGVLWFLFLIFTAEIGDGSDNLAYLNFIGHFLRPILISIPILIFCWVYLNKREVVDFYKRNS
jgi:hypothetical protein